MLALFKDIYRCRYTLPYQLGTMQQWLRTTLKIAGALISVLLLIWLGLAWYIKDHKKEILEKITSQLNKNINGTLQIEEMEPSFILSLPYFSVSLKNVSLYDSMYKYHHHDLLQASDVYVQIDPLSLLKRKPNIHQVTIKQGTVYIFTDITGYTNAYVLRKKDIVTAKSKNQTVFDRLSLEDIKFVYENKVKNKLFQLDIESLHGRIKYHNYGFELITNIKTNIKQLCFNTTKGSFLQNKYLEAPLNLYYSDTGHVLKIPEQTINIDEHPFRLEAAFSFSPISPQFTISISTKQIRFRDAASVTAPNIGHKFDSFDFKKPVDVSITVQGKMMYKDTPLVKVEWHIKNNTLTTPAGNITNCSMTGSFTNEVIKGGGHTDGNSEINISHMEAVYAGVPFKADTVHVFNIKKPVLYCHIRSSFQVQQMNDLLASNTIRFDNGTADADIIYQGGITEDDTVRPYINGYARIKNGGITYLPRALAFNNVNALLRFDGNDLFINNVQLKSGQSTMAMTGKVGNFLNLYFNSPDKILIDWSISSPFINVNEFSSFFTKRKNTVNTTARYNKKLKLAAKLDEMLSACNVRMQLRVNKVIYRTFAANTINADITLTRSGMIVQNVSLQHAGGSLNVSGAIGDLRYRKQFNIHAQVNKVKVDQLFYAFNDFGQDAIGNKNLKGALTAVIDMTGVMDENSKIVPNSMQGKVKFQLDNGALINFAPLENVSKYAFKKRNLSYLSFGSIKDELTIDREKITIAPMVVRTSAINFKIDGVYAPPKNTDINLEVPLRNPKEDSLELNDQNRDMSNWQKGIIIYLKATSDDNGKLKIGWDRSKGLIKNTNKEARQERREKRRERRNK